MQQLLCPDPSAWTRTVSTAASICIIGALAGLVAGPFLVVGSQALVVNRLSKLSTCKGYRHDFKSMH